MTAWSPKQWAKITYCSNVNKKVRGREQRNPGGRQQTAAPGLEGLMRSLPGVTDVKETEEQRQLQPENG